MLSEIVASPRFARSGERRGFALLITITLLSFLVLLLVSLASLTRVETQVASNNQQLGQARQNALSALNIAIGELQKYAGPDQRTTATADLAGDSTGARVANNTTPGNINNLEANPNGLTAVQTGTRYWTGVWHNTNTAAYTQKPDAVTQPAAVLLQWLVSGNEQTASGGSPTFTPAATINDLSAGMAATTLVKINGKADSGVLLVGPASVGTQNHPATAEGPMDRYVVAPLIDITAPAGSIPGLSTAATIGRYAWWVGDEGVKARVNLRPAYLRLSNASEVTKAKQRSFYTAQRSGLETVNYLAGAAIGAAYPYDQSTLDRVLTLDTLTMSASGSANQDTLKSATHTLFHDLTSVSKSVLADSYAGGLKKNLTAVLDTNAGPADADPIFTPLSSTDYGVPTWGQVRSWRQNAPASTDAAATWLLPTATRSARSPVVTYANLMFSLAVGQGAPASGYKLYLKVMPIAVLWNPYNTALAANSNAEIAMQLAGTGNLEFFINGTSRQKLNLRSALTTGTGADAFVFNINVPKLVPGESRMFNALKTAATVTDTDGETYEIYARGANTLQDQISYTTSQLLLDTGILLTQAELYTATGDENTATTFKLICTLQSTASPGTDNCNPNQLNAYLTKEGAYVAGLNSTDIYQKIENVDFLYLNNGSQVSTELVKETDTTFGGRNPLLVLNDKDHVFCYKMQAKFEARNNCSDDNRVGFNKFRFRSWVDGNTVAQHSARTKLDETGPSSKNYNSYRGNNYFGGVAFVYGDFFTSPLDAQPLLIEKNLTQKSGRAFNSGGNAQVLDIPKSDTPLLSLGQLQHAPLSILDSYPTYAFGNSAAPIRMDSTQQYVGNVVRDPVSKTYQAPFYDLSWHLNRALWDRYFVLGVDAATTQADLANGKPLPVANFDYTASGAVAPIVELRGAASYDKAAADVTVTGGFNINSTSVEAWKALLTGTNKVDDSGKILNAPMARFSTPPTSTATGAPWQYSGKAVDPVYNVYEGQRELLLRDTTTPAPTLDTTAETLAQLIVKEVRTRGPFLSVADFVNRRTLGPLNTRLRGTLQTAIDNPGGTSPVNLIRDSGDSTILSGFNFSSDFPSSYNKDNYVGDTSDGKTNATYRSHAAYHNYYLTQADVLTALGPRLTARSDTFRVRTYGESVNPVTGEKAKAWCEAIVQRSPQYVNTSDSPETLPADLKQSINQTFGRKFNVVSFRWLSPNDL